MIYRFVKKQVSQDGDVKGFDVKRIGAIDAEELEGVLKTHLEAGEELASAEEYDMQVIGALNKKIESLEQHVAKLEEVEKTEETPVVE